MSTSLAFTVVLTAVEGGWTQAQLRELPSVITCAPTQEQAREDVLDALREYLASLIQPLDVEPQTDTATSVVKVTIDAA